MKVYYLNNTIHYLESLLTYLHLVCRVTRPTRLSWVLQLDKAANRVDLHDGRDLANAMNMFDDAVVLVCYSSSVVENVDTVHSTQIG